jgi:hypothetical protein
MNKQANHVDTEIRSIANYQALIISKYYISSILILITLYLGFFRYNVISLYILIILTLFPHAFAVAIRDYADKTGARFLAGITADSSFQLASLKSKYNYTKLKYVSNSISYLITMLLIGLWQYSYNKELSLREEVRYLPLLVMSSGLLLRLLGVFYYRIRLSYSLSHD